MPKLKDRYSNEVIPALQGEFQYVNPMQVPRVQKIVVNIGMGEALQNAKALDAAIGDGQGQRIGDRQSGIDVSASAASHDHESAVHIGSPLATRRFS